MVKSDAYLFTINNYTDEDINCCRNAVDNDVRCTYIIFGFELAPNTGTPHLQGYVQFTTRILSSTVERLLGGRAHMDKANGSDEDNYKYCRKIREEDTVPNERWEEYGTRTERSRRSKKRLASEVFVDIRDALLAGASIADIATNFPMEFIKHHTGISKMAKIMSNPPLERFFGPFPEWLHHAIDIKSHDWRKSLVVVGSTGVGKTQFILSCFENPLLVSLTEELKGFRAGFHDAIIFDDVSVAHWPRNSQLHLVDVECRRGINVKGTHVVIPAFTKKVFTCNPTHFPFTEGDSAINRRINVIRLRAT